jgi:hypothetical protein
MGEVGIFYGPVVYLSYGHLEFCGHLVNVHLVHFCHVVPRKIWQPCYISLVSQEKEDLESFETELSCRKNVCSAFPTYFEVKHFLIKNV